MMPACSMKLADSPGLCRYVLAAAEHSKRVRRNDRVLQVAFGSGFKCNSVVWRALKANNTQHAAWAPSTGKKS